MHKYAILCNPGHNRVYFESSKKMSFYELSIALESLDISFSNVKEEYIQDIFYITFESETVLNEDENTKISKLSFVFALFEIVEKEENLFKPIKLNKEYIFIDKDISSILKYTGKTNEIFTNMLINIAVNSTSTNSENIRLLDPIAGKGTTLYEGLTCGYDVYGVEISDSVTHEAYNYVKKYLEIKRYKHTSKQEKLSGKNKSFTAKTYTFEIGKDKETFKTDKRTLKLIAGNSAFANQYFKKNFFDVIVGDLPYGVQHGNVTKEKKPGLTRNPKELVQGAVSAWYDVLKVGGVICLAWNSFVLSYEDFQKLLEEAGFTVLDSDNYKNFEHMVDKSIRRDLIVAKKIKK